MDIHQAIGEAAERYGLSHRTLETKSVSLRRVESRPWLLCSKLSSQSYRYEEDEQDATQLMTSKSVRKVENVEFDMEGTQKDMMTDLGASETAAGALSMIALTRENRDIIARARGIEPLIALFDGGSESATEQASLALQRLVVENTPNQLAIINASVKMLKVDRPRHKNV